MSEVRARWVEFKQLLRALATADDESVRLQMVVDSAPALVPGCDHAGLTLNAAGGVATLVGSDDVVQRANELQFELGEGPCLNMRRDQDTLLSNDLSQDDRWPRWANTVTADLGVHSMLSLLVFTERQSYGALSLYASGGRDFDADDVAISQGLAGHLALIMATSREIRLEPECTAARSSDRRPFLSWVASTSTPTMPSNTCVGCRRTPTRRLSTWLP